MTNDEAFELGMKWAEQKGLANLTDVEVRSHVIEGLAAHGIPKDNDPLNEDFRAANFDLGVRQTANKILACSHLRKPIFKHFA